MWDARISTKQLVVWPFRSVMAVNCVGSHYCESLYISFLAIEKFINSKIIIIGLI